MVDWPAEAQLDLLQLGVHQLDGLLQEVYQPVCLGPAFLGEGDLGPELVLVGSPLACWLGVSVDASAWHELLEGSSVSHSSLDEEEVEEGLC